MTQRTLLFAVCMLAGAVGCDKPRFKIHPVKLRVLYNEKPAVNAAVVFHPQEDDPELQKLRPNGTVDENGDLQLTTYDPGDGAPAGKYKLTLEWRGPAAGSNDAEMAASGEDRLGGRFSDVNTSALTAEVQEGVNELPPIDLAKSPRQ